MIPVRHALQPANAKSSKLNHVDGLNTASRTTGNWPSLLLRLAFASVSITTILAVTNQQHLAAQQVASQAPPAQRDTQRDAALPSLPIAVPITVDDNTLPLTIEADLSSRYGKLDRLEGNVVIHYNGRTVRADRITYDAETGDLAMTAMSTSPAATTTSTSRPPAAPTT